MPTEVPYFLRAAIREGSQVMVDPQPTYSMIHVRLDASQIFKMLSYVCYEYVPGTRYQVPGTMVSGKLRLTAVVVQVFCTTAAINSCTYPRYKYAHT